MSQPIVISYASGASSGKVTWRSSSNLALVKHIGRRERQLPGSPSLSFTLSNANAELTIEYEFIDAIAKPGLHFSFDGSQNSALAKRLSMFIDNLVLDIPVLSHLRMNISFKINIPTVSGISVSSAIYSGLALCLCKIEEKLTGEVSGALDFYRKASYLARIGATNACRSVYGGYVIWGECDEYSGFSNLFAQPFPYEVHSLFKEVGVSMLVVETGKRALAGGNNIHNLLKTHPYSVGRYDQARKNAGLLIRSLQSGDADSFVKIVENEALSLHALLISSGEAGLMLKPESVMILDKFIAFRNKNHLPACFTLELGPNITLVYPMVYKEHIDTFIKNELQNYCENNMIINDKIGRGPLEIK